MKWSKFISVFLVIVTLLPLVATCVSASGYALKVTIYYKSESGDTLASTVSTTINAADSNKPSWTSPSISGYYLKNSSDAVVTYSMLTITSLPTNYIREGSATYTVYYVKEASKTVNYVYNHNNATAAPSKTQTGKIGDSYSITSPTITGYTPSAAVISGTFTSTTSTSVVRYAEKSYTVSFNANGGSGAPSSVKKYYFTTLVLPTDTPVRYGYSFLGWSGSSTATSAGYSPGGSFTLNRDITLYAVWSTNTYAVTYNGNGGSGAPSTQYKQFNVPLTLSTKVPTRSGYVFSGWARSATGSVAFQPGDSYTSNSKMNLYAIWTAAPKQYTVSYNANGGSGAPSSQTKTEGVALTLSSTKPTRSGYTFLGWGTSSSATVASYSAGGTYTSDASITLYAVWSKIPSTYTVSYNANGGSGAPSSQTKTENVTLTLSSTKPTRSGYTFLGWGTSSSATTAAYSAGGSYTANASITLYAVWSKNVSYYTVSYNANGGSGAPSAQTKTENVTLTLSSTKPTRSGYTFLGWSSSSSATSPTYYAGGSYTANASVTLYAVWSKVLSTYTVSYNANGGSGAPSSQTKTEGAALTLSSTVPSRSGYTFLGWGTSSSSTSPSYSAGGSYTIDASITLYAVWSKNTSYYTVSYSSNGGSGAPLSQTKTEDVPLTLSSTKPTRSGYTFLGWGTSSSATSPSYYPGGTYTANASITLYAVWSKVLSTYTVSYNANGGSGAPSAQTKTEGVALTLSSTVPFRSGYSFLGWGTSSSSTSPSYSAGGTYTADASITLYAVWSKNTSYYTVSYSANGGSGAPLAQTKTENVALTLSSQEPTRSGYTFLGWSSNSSATSPTYYPGGTYTANASITLYAVWSKILSTYTISYNANGGSGAPSSQTKTEGVALTLSSTIPFRSGYSFLGWGTSSSSTSPSYSAGGSYTADASITFYAVWSKNNSYYTVSYSANGGSGAPLAQTKTENVALTLSSTTPTRSGYTFLGWGTSSSSTSPSYYPGGIYTANASITLYAVWSKILSTYTVSYNANGGSGAPSSQTKTEGVALTLSSTKPTRSGYSFLGWGTSSSSTSPSYSSGGTYIADASITLYAIWSKNASYYTVSYSANGGSGAPSAQTKNENVALTLSSTKPTRSGYTFLGWSSSSSATSPTYYAGGTYTANASVTLYAVWSRNVSYYAVNYYANGGSGAPEAQVKIEDVALTLSSISPYRSGYIFSGWATSSTSSVISYYPGSTFSGNYSLDLYAVWQRSLASYTVNYDANGGSGAPSSQTKIEDTVLTLSSTKPTRSGYTFLGWSTSSSATSPTYYAGGTYTANASITLYAVWSRITYTVSYDANGGSGAPFSQIKYYGQVLTISNTVPTRDGYTFLGWSESSSAASPSYYAGGQFGDDRSVTLYAVWQEHNYDFSISALEVTPDTVTQYETVNIRFRIDSWDEYNNYSDIPVEVLLNGTQIYYTTVYIYAYGVKYIEFNLNVGEIEGMQSLVARVNWVDHHNETRTGNNSVSATFTVKKAIETSVDQTGLSGEYIEGFDVISSFYVRNEGSSDVTPDDGVTFTLKVYSTAETVFEGTKTVVIPAGGTNIVYFKWTVPENSAGTVYWCRGTISESTGDGNTDNNSTEFSIVSASLPSSTTPNTRYEEKAPATYDPMVTPPSDKAGSASWNEWVYENDSFVLKTYGITVSGGNPMLTPSAGCKTAVKDGSLWKLGSGYGVSLSWTPVIISSGVSTPSRDSYTEAQSVYATFPEYAYVLAQNKYDTLDDVAGTFMFKPNPDADNTERVHFIPLYVKDGLYSVSVSASYIWTPAGMVTATKSASVIIRGTMYDDWYQG